MRRYLFGTGLFTAIVTGIPLLRSLRSREQPFTWRTVLEWVSWGLTLALAIGAMVDVYRASRGHLVSSDSPIAGEEDELFRRRLRRR